MLGEIELTMAEFKLFQKLMYSHAGISLSERKHALVQNRLKKRMRILDMKSYREYHDIVNDPSNQDEFQECLNALTTNETYFFRHKKHWDFIIQEIVPVWLQDNQNTTNTLRVWSAASSSGEEPYSAAIALHDSVCSKGGRVAIDATDINKDVLNRAGKAIYDSYAVQKLTKGCISKYFTQQGDKFELTKTIKNLVSFRLHNLLKSPNNVNYDIVFLRNVMIYFDQESKSKVMRNVTDRLKSGGYLFLGGAETIAAFGNEYTYVRPTIYRKK